MANLKELGSQIRTLHTKKDSDTKDTDKKIKACFELLELYCAIPRKKLTMDDCKHCCYAALVLSGNVRKDLGGEAWEFLKKNEDKLPERAVELIRASILRMEAF